MKYPNFPDTVNRNYLEFSKLTSKSIKKVAGSTTRQKSFGHWDLVDHICVHMASNCMLGFVFFCNLLNVKLPLISTLMVSSAFFTRTISSSKTLQNTLLETHQISHMKDIFLILMHLNKVVLLMDAQCIIMQSRKVCESSVLWGNFLADWRNSLTELGRVFNLYHVSVPMYSHKGLSGDLTIACRQLAKNSNN